MCGWHLPGWFASSDGDAGVDAWPVSAVDHDPAIDIEGDAP
jgi:hypothetical protein